MKKPLFFSLLLLFGNSYIYAENNTTVKPAVKKHIPAKKSTENNETNQSKRALIEQKIKEQIAREKKFAKEQKFYQGDAYDLKEHEVDPATLSDVPAIEPDYDFDITDVYRDDI